MATAKRELNFLLAEPERRLLRAIAARIPGRFNSNHLTAVGVLGALGTGLSYGLSSLDPRWLWAASVMLAVNWFGDSLDGTLARVRKAERPRYGYYLDHIVDAFSTAAIGVGIGLSPFVSFPLAMGLVVLYLTLSINVYLESQVFGVFRLAYGIVGPTETRIILMIANTLLVLLPQTQGIPLQLIAVAGNVVAALLAIGMLTTLSVRFGKNLHRLAKLEPSRKVSLGGG
jgi:phosphatidylglycerophosphate synthase